MEMYGTYGIEANLKTIYALCSPFVQNDESIETMVDLKPAYIRFLRSIHPEFPIENGEIVVNDPLRIAAFGNAFRASLIDDLQQERMIGDLYEEKLFIQNALHLEKGLSALRKLDPVLGELFDLAVHAIVLCGSGKNQEGRRAHGGTSNRCIGVIWLNINPDVSIENIVEMLVHELTHTLVFLDELSTAHFNYSTIGHEEFWALSSILKRKRPMDKVIHSIVVSTEILHARMTYLQIESESSLIHPRTEDLVASTRAAISSVLNHPRIEGVCGPRAIEIVKFAKDFLDQNFLKEELSHARFL
jgi:hypothetical protein